MPGLHPIAIKLNSKTTRLHAHTRGGVIAWHSHAIRGAHAVPPIRQQWDHQLRWCKIFLGGLLSKAHRCTNQKQQSKIEMLSCKLHLLLKAVSLLSQQDFGRKRSRGNSSLQAHGTYFGRKLDISKSGWKFLPCSRTWQNAANICKKGESSNCICKDTV